MAKLFANSRDPDETPQNIGVCIWPALFANYPFGGLKTKLG